VLGIGMVLGIGTVLGIEIVGMAEIASEKCPVIAVQDGIVMVKKFTITITVPDLQIYLDTQIGKH
jgi:hypothetical protein